MCHYLNKGVLIIGLFLFSLSGYSQTRAYKYLYSVAEATGVKTNEFSNTVWYITFTNNACYFSNKDGIANTSSVYYYIQQYNGMYIYKEQSPVSQFLGGENYLYFSRDYRRLNWDCKLDYNMDSLNKAKRVRVLEYTINNEQPKTQQKLY